MINHNQELYREVNSKIAESFFESNTPVYFISDMYLPDSDFSHSIRIVREDVLQLREITEIDFDTLVQEFQKNNVLPGYKIAFFIRI